MLCKDAILNMFRECLSLIYFISEHKPINLSIIIYQLNAYTIIQQDGEIYSVIKDETCFVA